NCTTWFAPDSYDSCESVLAFTWLEFDDLYHINPSIKSDCTGLPIGTYYCISTNEDGSPPGEDDSDGTLTSAASSTATATVTGVVTPSPVQSNMVSDCEDFYLVQADDGCWAIADSNNIELNDFYKWNPSVKNDCTGLGAKVYVCVGIKAATSTTSGNSGSTSSPVQDGIASDCKDFYFVQADDGCWAISNTNGINLADFYEWNPAVKSDCSGLQANVYVC
ncbi:hypothetical protein BKA56DRAFT_454257, partial [Ilyonectria sp. MPI-CAGE-AT-0026]